MLWHVWSPIVLTRTLFNLQITINWQPEWIWEWNKLQFRTCMFCFSSANYSWRGWGYLSCAQKVGWRLWYYYQQYLEGLWTLKVQCSPRTCSDAVTPKCWGTQGHIQLFWGDGEKKVDNVVLGTFQSCTLIALYPTS